MKFANLLLITLCIVAVASLPRVRQVMQDEFEDDPDASEKPAGNSTQEAFLNYTQNGID
jgi:hypothetical protein